MPALDLIPVGSKFAVLGIRTTLVSPKLPAVTKVNDSLLVTRELPLTAPPRWRELLGTMRSQRFDSTELFIVAHAKADQPMVQDSQSQGLTILAYQLYWCLLLTHPFFAHEEAVDHSGVRLPDSFDMQSRQEYPPLPWVAWAPRHEQVAPDTLSRAAKLLPDIIGLLGSGVYQRLGRGMTAFYNAIRNNDIGARTLDFVRAVETFIYPPIGQARDAFVKRGRVLVGDGHDEALGQMYDIRSAAVHLHDPVRQLPSVAKRERQLLLLRRCFQAEALARYCFEHFPRRKELHAYFQDDQTLEVFWNASDSIRDAAWGPKMNFGAVLDGLKEAWVDDETLGLV